MPKYLPFFKITLVIFLMTGATVFVAAQDIHYSQFGRSPANISPALTGLFKGDLRFIGNYRRQWQQVPVSYMTFSGGFDQKFINTNLPNSLMSLGLYLNHDEAGDLELSNTTINLAGSYTHRLAKQHFLTAGVQIGGGQKRFDSSALRVDNQYDGDGFNALLPTGEEFDKTNVVYFDMGGGVNYRFQNVEKRWKIDLGAGIFHVNEPNQSFYSQGEDLLDQRYSFYGMTSFGVGERLDIGGRAIVQVQGPHQETLVALDGKIHLNQQRDSELSVGFGLGYRIRDAFIPTLIIDYRMWSVGFSYDVNASDFSESTFYRGGPELSVIYIFSKVRPPKEFEICPIF